MIKINKDISAIPNSLKLPFEEFFPNGVPLPTKTTHDRRMEVINGEKYINEEKYNDRYKQEDTKNALKAIYHSKCAFCEQRIEQSHVEHYRPKDKYYWLAYSWDNLLLACPICNQNKGTNFEIKGDQINFENTIETVANIHNSSINYDDKESPKMVNPEVTDPSDKIIFQKNGSIESEDENFAYTIEKCKIDRIDLNDQRRKLLETFKHHITSALVDSKNKTEKEIIISTIVRNFIDDSKDLDLQFLAFRRFAINHNWLNQIIKDLN